MNSRRRLFFVFVLSLIFICPTYAEVETVPDVARSKIPSPKLKARSWVLMDYQSGWVLAQQNANKRIEPASLSKLMTAFIVFRELQSGALKLQAKAFVSKKAWRTGGSRMFIKVGSQVSIEDLLKGMIIQSGNDASVALAEHIAGSEDGFAALMNQQAKDLGMNNTHFMNSTGWPHPDHYSTAMDLTVLSRELIRRFPEYYKWYSVKEFRYNNIKQGNRNLLLWRDPTVDGVKTGHTASAGYCLIGSSKKDGMRLIATVTGTKGARQRASAVAALLKYGYAAYESRPIQRAGAPATQVKVFKGEQDVLPVGFAADLFVTIPRGAGSRLKTAINLKGPYIAPINQGQSLGVLSVTLGGKALGEYPLVALQPVAEGSWFQQIVGTVQLWFE